MSNIFDSVYHLSVDIRRDLHLGQPPLPFLMPGIRKYTSLW